MKTLTDIKHPVTICRASAGTGKTYTLAAYYVGLLLSGEDYRSILAITFTNKATTEMSERILGYLHGIANGEERDFLGYARQFMLRNNAAADEELERRAAECFKQMLLDYDNVQIMTIDSFLQTLLSGLASVLRMSVGLKTELDQQHVIRRAVEQLLSTDMTEDDRRIISDYMHLRLDEAADWNVESSLCDLANELYNESVQMMEAEGKIHFDSASIAQLRASVQQKWETHPDIVRLHHLLGQIDHADLRPTNGKAIETAAKNIRLSLADPKKLRKETRFRGLTDPQLASAREGKWKQLSAEVVAAVIEATDIIRRMPSFVYTKILSLELSHDMELMASLQRIIQRNLNEANSALLSKTASTLSNALQTGDADFILEKAGIRYKHVLMDEFQDTSRLQWSVIEQLLRDVLAGAGNTLLIVGDIKQSIYRWRNGDWHIMDGLDQEIISGPAGERVNKRFTSLTRNFRSSERVVEFNLSLFRYIMENYANVVENADEDEQKLVKRIYDEGFEDAELDHFYRSDDKRGGYVRFKTFTASSSEDGEESHVSDIMLKDMFDTMEDLLSKGMDASDMMVLVRKGYQAAQITNAHRELDENLYPHLKAVSFVSATSYLLDASDAVKTIINALRVVTDNDSIASQYVEIATQKPGIIEDIRARIHKRMPLYEAVNELIRLLLADEDGQYHGSETAYLNSMLDFTRDFVGTYGSDIDEFLKYWDDTLHEKAIPASPVGAIRIMTIHKSKGLQAQTLFVPFCNWKIDESKRSQKIWCRVAEELDEREEYIPIPNKDEITISAYRRESEEEHLNQRIDSLNMLYVALTRAEDNLYISTSCDLDKDGNRKPTDHVGKYIMDFAGGDEYEKGELVIKSPKKQAENEGEIPYAELWANSSQVRFVQSQEGALYTDYGDEAYRRVARMDEGVLCHEIFANLTKADELDAVLDDFETRGEIASGEQRETLRQLVSSACEGSDEMRDWFTSPWEVRREEPIFVDNKEVRPDRVMINPKTNEAIVLDYKFGHWEDKYIQQVRGYMDALRGMGYRPVRGYLWFARKNQLREVHE